MNIFLNGMIKLFAQRNLCDYLCKQHDHITKVELQLKRKRFY